MVDGVAERNVARYAFVEAVFAEDAEGGGETAFEVVAFGVLVVESWSAGVEVSGKGVGRMRYFCLSIFLRRKRSHFALGDGLLDSRLERCSARGFGFSVAGLGICAVVCVWCHDDDGGGGCSV